MGNEQYSDTLLQAMSIIAKKAVSEAQFNKTIQAVIVECKDASIEKYRVRYQDGFWEAYGNGSGVTYLPGASVYILVPNGDMSQPKTIIGTVEKLGINYINTISEENQYYENGSNTLSTNQFELRSYQTKTIEIYNRNKEKNLIDINEEETSFYLKNSSHLKCSFNIKTNLDLYQRYSGNYGIKFYLTFLDKAREEQVIREYIFDTYLMTGNPYLYTNKVLQTTVFEIDGVNFQYIDRIELFTEGFPKQAEKMPADIFISNLAIVGVNQLSQQQMSGVSLSFVAKNGYIFNDKSKENDERKIQAIVRILGKTVSDTISQKLSFYWFVQNISISKSSPFYNQYGGYGWKCLNSYKILEQNEKGNPSLIDFNPAGSSITIYKNDVKIKQQKYKCVVLYGDKSFSKEFSIINNDAEYEVQIQSDKGTQFTLDSGHPTLKCILKHQGKEIQNYDDFNFHWGVINNKGNFSTLSETNDIYQKWHNAVDLASELEKAFKENQLLKNRFYEEGGNKSNEKVYNEAKEIIQTYQQTEIIHANYIYHVNIKKIVNFSTFVCTVLDSQSNVIGSKEITLINNSLSNGGYSLIINNGKQSFNYDEQGISPCKNEKINFIIPELSFSLLNEKGEQVDQNEIKPDNINWIFPNENDTLLTDYLMREKQRIPQGVNGPIIYPKTRIFSYGILDRYKSNRSNNDIQLRVKYNGYTLTAKTNLLFTKQGFLGTNGTGVSLRIILKDRDDNPINELPYYKKRDNNEIKSNFEALEAQLYENGEKIISNDLTYNWSILKSKGDSTNLEILNNNTKKIRVEYNEKPLNTPIVNIIKVSVVYNGTTVYATLPIITYQVKPEYDLKLVPNTGFQYVFYAEDGTRPQYDNKYPFTFLLTETSPQTNNKEQDITNIQLYKLNEYNFRHSFNYYVEGNLEINSNDNNTCTVTPYKIYDGSVLNNCLICEVNRREEKGNSLTLIARARIPIHMMLNRYGHAALNDWDGNSIQIKEENHIILSPQVGAGQKDKKTNTFTGILMGTVQRPVNNDSTIKENGLFGYSNGDRTIFLDAKTGNANFGIAGHGQIKIDAKQSTITGGGYDATKYNDDITKDKNTSGMLIHLGKPEIRFGSKKFYITPAGQLYAQGGGQIAGWNIGTDKLSKATVGMSSDNKDSKDQTKINNDNIAFWAGNVKPSDAPFSVNFNGHLKSTSIDVGGNVHIKNGKIYSGKHDTLSSTQKGFYLDHTGLSIGGNFKVSYVKDKNGNEISLLSVQKGYIGNSTNGFTIDNNVIYNGKEEFNSTNNGIYLGKDGISLGYNEKLKTTPFSVNNTGYLTATSGKLAGWSFNNEALYNGVSIAAYDDGKGGVYRNGIYFGPGGLRMGANFHVNRAGSLYCIDGSIGGWEIKAGSLKGNSLKLYSTGAINDNGDTWHIAANGEATFKNIKSANIHGGEISGGSRTGGTIAGRTQMTGGTIGGSASMVGGTISTSQVMTTSGISLDKWCENIVAKTVTADEIKSKIATINTVEMNYVYIRRGGDIRDGYGKSEIASRKYVDKKIGDATSSIWEAISDIRGKLPK